MSSTTTEQFPVAGRLAWWGTAWLRGHVGPDDLLDGVIADDVTHVVLGSDAGPGLLGALAALRTAGASGFGATFPAEGDLVGLGGPVVFNDAVLEVGEGVVAVGTESGLVPTRVGPTVEWQVLPARRRQLPDVGESDREMRAVLPETAERLAVLDVARWRPEVADRLMNLRHRPAIDAPPGVPARCVDLAARGLQALGIAELALEDDGGALSVWEMDQRRDALAPLARAGRRALVAACSPEVWPPD
ncbi:hypothetical protein [Nocardioides sp. 1609]|uniref:hypothetical protein n=1 Tax=Nocardioides sp. 1609 TaxID=2508327 RepID=UPI00107064AF|nr:hypothetical protein [Nocardioides sp. 1609]